MTTELRLFGELLEPKLLETAQHLIAANSTEDFQKLEAELKDLSVDELVEMGAAFVNTGKASAIAVGKTAYEIRTRTQDGLWGREVFRLAERWETSERTIHRWMKTAQEHFGFELTSAQKNAQVTAEADTSRQKERLSWDEDDSPEDAGFGDIPEEEGRGFYGWDPEQQKDVWIPSEDGDEFAHLDEREAFNKLIGEPWAERDSVTPSPKYENKMPGSFTPTPLLLPPDDTWIEFTKAQIQAEHPGFTDQAASRSATARWASRLETAPLDLLEELEMIHGGSLPDEVISKLHEAEEHKVLKPDEVTEGGKKSKRGPAAPKGLSKVAEKLMETSRELHGRIHAGTQEGTVSDEEIIELAGSITGAAHTMEGLKKMVNQAKDRLKKAEAMARKGDPEF